MTGRRFKVMLARVVVWCTLIVWRMLVGLVVLLLGFGFGGLLLFGVSKLLPDGIH